MRIISGGWATENSVGFIYKKRKVEAVRQSDGTIVIEETKAEKANWKEILEGIVVKLLTRPDYLLVYTILFKDFVLDFEWPVWLYHFPTFVWVVWGLKLFLQVVSQREVRMYHAAEHMVANWYSKKNAEIDLEGIKKCSRVHFACGTNQMATIMLFQIVSSLCFAIWGESGILSVIELSASYMYMVFPFNFVGLLFQLFCTTAPPTEQHIEVANRAMTALLQMEKE